MSIRRSRAVEQIFISLSIGFFASLFGCYIMVQKMEVHLEYITEKLVVLEKHSEKINSIERRLAVIEVKK